MDCRHFFVVAATLLLAGTQVFGQGAPIALPETESSVDSSAQERPKGVTAKAVFEVIEAVGELVGAVFDILEAFAPDPAQEALDAKLNAMSEKLDSIQLQIGEMSLQVTRLATDFKIKTDQIMNQVTQASIVTSSSTIKDTCDHFSGKIKSLNQTTTKDTAFWNQFKASVKTVCTDASVLDMKRQMGVLSAHMIGDASYTGGLDAYTDTIVNRITIPSPGETWPSKTASEGYELLSSYYGEKAMLLYNGLAFIQAYYYANDNRAEFFVYYQDVFKPNMDKLAAKFLGCVNRIVAAQANLRSVNSEAYLKLFKEVSFDETVVYSQAIVEGICQKADFLAALTGDLKVKGKVKVTDDSGSSKEVDELVNRGKLGVFLRYFSEPSAFPNTVTITASATTSMTIGQNANYCNLVPVSNHLDWQWGLTNGDNRFWKKANKLSFALFRRMDENMSNGGSWTMRHAVELPLGSGKHNYTTSGDYSLIDYDLTTGEPATSSTVDTERVKMQYLYRAETDRGYRSSSWKAQWQTDKTYVTWGDHKDPNIRNQYLNPTVSPNTYAVNTAGGRINTHIAGRYTGYHSYYGYNRYAILPNDSRLWVNAGSGSAQISVKEQYYLKECVARMSGRLWIACQLDDGLIKTDPGDYSLDWGLSAKDAPAAPFKEVGVTDPAETRSYDLWPRMMVKPNKSASFSLLLYEALSHKWAWFNAQNNVFDADFGSQTGAYEILVDAQLSNSVWVTSGAAGAASNNTAAASEPDFAVISMPNGTNGAMNILELAGTDTEFTPLALGDFNGDGVEDCLVLSSDNATVCFISVNIGANVETDTQNARDRVKTISPEIGTLCVLNEGDSFVEACDFNGDLTSDLLIHRADGSLAILYINCGAVSSEGAVASTPAGDILSSGDFNGDGIDDLLFYDKVSTTFTIMFGGDALAPYVIPNEDVAGMDSSLFAVEDCNGDGVEDLVWTDNTTSEVYITCFGTDGKVLMDGPVEMKDRSYKQGWKLFAVADLNLDGCADYLWRAVNKKGVSRFRVNFMSGFEAAPKSAFCRSGNVRLPSKGSLPADAKNVELE